MLLMDDDDADDAADDDDGDDGGGVCVHLGRYVVRRAVTTSASMLSASRSINARS